MKFTSRPKTHQLGVTLIESMVAVGVLAVAIPMVFGSIAESGKSGMSSLSETTSSWIVPACMNEIAASRSARGQYITNTTPGTPLIGSYLAFSQDGSPIGTLSAGAYTSGTTTLSGKRVAYIAAITSDPTVTGSPAMLKVKVTVESPAAAPAAKREKLDFYSQIP